MLYLLELCTGILFEARPGPDLLTRSLTRPEPGPVGCLSHQARTAGGTATVGDSPSLKSDAVFVKRWCTWSTQQPLCPKLYDAWSTVLGEQSFQFVEKTSKSRFWSEDPISFKRLPTTFSQEIEFVCMSIDINFPANLVGKLNSYIDISYVMWISLQNLMGKLEWWFKPCDINFPA